MYVKLKPFLNPQLSRAIYDSVQYTNRPRLPDGIVAHQKSQFWYILEGLGTENLGCIFGHLVLSYSQMIHLWRFG
jgi:hypothetical protein